MPTAWPLTDQLQTLLLPAMLMLMLMLMTYTDHRWGLSNPGPDTLLVWLEPWAEEFAVPVRSTITMMPRGRPDGHTLGEVEWTSDHLVVWANAQTVEIFIDGVLQDSSSAVIPVPDGLTKEMLNVAFAGQPAARLSGAGSNAIKQVSWWQRLRRRLGL